MRPLPVTVAFTLAITAFGARDVHAYCVRNAISSMAVHAEVVALGGVRPPKVFGETVAADREFCCNPKNLDCNPDRTPDAGNVAFEARVEAGPGQPAVPCGIATTDARFPSRVGVMAPVRGTLRFERNAGFDATRPVSGDNPRFFLHTFRSDNHPAATYSCPPRALSGTPRS